MSKKQKNRNKQAENRVNLFEVLRPYRWVVALLVFIALAGNAINLLIPRIIAGGIDAFSADNFEFRKVIVQFLAAAIGILFFTFLQSVLQTVTAEKVAKNMRNKVAGKIAKQSYEYILRSNPSRLLTNLTSDMDSVKMFVSQAFVNIISSLFIIIGAAAMLLSINVKLALAVLGMVPLIAIAFYIVFKKVRVLFRKSREVIDALNKVINESILGSALIRVLNSQQPESQKFLERNVESRELGLSIVRLFSVLVPVIMFVSNLAVVTILAMGGHFVVMDSLSLGNFAAFNSYLVMLIFPVMMIGFMSNVIASASASYGRIKKVLEEDPPAVKGKLETPLSGQFAVKNISLSYGESPVLKKVSFEVAAGSNTAIIGPTAAGKSQLLYVLSNLISPDEGRIEFDGQEVNEYSLEAFHRYMGFVFQDSVLFNLSLRENIAFSDDVTEETLQKAIETAELDEFIQKLPNKLDTLVSERGTSLSGGQKQRIMLARALAMNPSILLLDDFTARVDRKTENKILCNIQANYPDLSLLSVTQKIAPVRHFDQILLLMKGEIIARGKHEELLKNSPEYMQIYNSQLSTSHYEL